jgi:hypothetical protein
VADLSKTEQDPMLAKLRTQLRGMGICKKPKEKFGISCVYSIDNPFSSADVSKCRPTLWWLWFCGGGDFKLCDGGSGGSAEKIRWNESETIRLF